MKKIREKTNKEICDANDLPYVLLTNIVEEKSTKDTMRATSELIAKALTATLGPYGSSTIIQDREGRHFATKDGYDLMNRLSFDNEVSRTILDIFRNTASSQVYNVGDGSTSAIVVANALFQALTDPGNKEMFENVPPKDIVDILNYLAEYLEGQIKAQAKPITKGMPELDVIAAVANNNDENIGKTVAEIYRKVGRHGFISMDVLDRADKDTYEIKTGIEWERGYIDKFFDMDTKDGRIVYDNNPRVILSNSSLSYDDLEVVLMPLMKKALNQEGAELLIVANDFDEDVRQFLKANRTKHLRIAAKDVPMIFTAVDIDQVTQGSREKLEDLALILGCTIYDKFKTQKADILAHPEKYVGYAEKIVITPKNTEIIANLKNETVKKDIQAKVKEYEKELDKLGNLESPSKEEDMKIYHLKSRISRLTNSSAVFHVAGKTLAERMTRQRLIEDSIFACKSAIKNGYVPGGNLIAPKILLEHKDELVAALWEKYKYFGPNGEKFLSFLIDLIIRAFLVSYESVLGNSCLSEEQIENIVEACLKDGAFYNIKKHCYEDWDTTTIINSADTDIQIVRSCMSIVAILATSNQMLTLNIAPVFTKKEG